MMPLIFLLPRATILLTVQRSIIQSLLKTGIPSNCVDFWLYYCAHTLIKIRDTGKHFRCVVGRNSLILGTSTFSVNKIHYCPHLTIFNMTDQNVSFFCMWLRACERSGAWSERGAERTKYSRSAERVFIQRPERSLCLAPVPLRYRSHHEPRACTNPPRIHLCLQQLTKLSAYTSKIVRCEGEIWSSWNISKSKPTGHTGAQFLSKK